MRTTRMLYMSSLFALFGATMALAAPPEKQVQQQKGSEMMQVQTEQQKGLPESARARMGEIQRNVEQNKLVTATQVYRAIVKGEKSVPHEVSEKARCIAVFPGVFSGAAVVGGSHGSGVASCRTQAGNWSKPAFLDISTASIGAQIGAKSSDLVLFMLTSEAENQLKEGKITLGSDVSVTAGSYDRGWNGGASNVVAYEQSEGGMMGISLNGSTLKANGQMNTNYYGRNVDLVSILEEKANLPTDGNINSFISELPTTHIM